jgi:chromosome segregation ATPase
MPRQLLIFLVAILGITGSAGLATYYQWNDRVQSMVRFDAIESKLGNHSNRIKPIEIAFSELDERIAKRATEALAARLARLDNNLSVVETRAAELRAEAATLDARSKQVAADLRVVEDLLSDHSATLAAIRRTRRVDGLLLDGQKQKERQISVPSTQPQAQKK